MANFGKLIITKEGMKLQARAEGGTKLEAKRMALGSGKGSGNYQNYTALIKEEVSVNITDTRLNSDSKAWNFEGFFDNAGIQTGFEWREIGLFMKDPDNSQKEILFCYSNAGDTSDYIPANSDERYEKHLTIQVAFSNAQDLTIVAPDFVSVIGRTEFNEYKSSQETKLNDHFNNKSNPHEVNKAQVGLGNVDNTRDLDKPISNATKEALNGKIDVISVIPNNTDLNSLTEFGFYRIGSNTNAATLKNCPTTNAFFMIVGTHAGTYQEITEYNTSNPKKYMRNKYNSNWGQWYRIYTEADNPMAVQIQTLMESKADKIAVMNEDGTQVVKKIDLGFKMLEEAGNVTKGQLLDRDTKGVLYPETTVERVIGLQDFLDEKANIDDVLNGGIESTGNSFSGATSDYGLEISKIKGNYSQMTTKGYQLFDASKLPTTSKGGATVTNNGDGSFTISGSGTPSEVTSLMFDFTHDETIKMLKVGNLTLKCGAKTMGYMYAQIRDSSQNLLGISNVNGDGVATSTGVVTQEMLNKPDVFLRIGYINSTSSPIIGGTIKPMLYQDGDGTFEPFTGGQPSPNPQYPQEVKFFKPNEINSVSKQMFNFEWFKNNKVSGGTKTYTTNSITLTSTRADCYDTSSEGKGFMIKVKPNTKYTLLFKRNAVINGNTFIFSYDKEQRTITPHIMKSGGTKDFYYTFTTYYNCEYISFRVGIAASGQSCTFSDFILVEGEYNWDTIGEIPKYGGQYTTPFDIELRSLPNGISDEVVYLGNGKWQIIRRVGEVMFDGSSDENWSISTEFKNTIRINCTTSLKYSNSYSQILSENFVRYSHSITSIDTNDVEGVWKGINNDTTFRFKINKSRLETKDVSGIKQMLSKNPITVHYELTTPITEEIELHLIPSYHPYTKTWHDSEVEAQEFEWKARTFTDVYSKEETDEKFFSKLDVVPIENGGTGATTAEEVLKNLGIKATVNEINNLQGYDLSGDIKYNLNLKSCVKDGQDNAAKTITMTPRPNLLKNADYRLNIVNQKGQQLYSANSSYYYGFDCWRTKMETSYVAKTAGSYGFLSLVTDGNSGEFTQFFDFLDYRNLNVINAPLKTFTCGIIVSKKLYVVNDIKFDDTTRDIAGLTGIKIKCGVSTVNYLPYFSIIIEANSRYNIQFVKLEHGNTYTGIPDYDFYNELEKCYPNQFKVCSSNINVYIGSGYVQNDATAHIFVDIPKPLRSVLEIIQSGSFELTNGRTTKTVDYISYNSLLSNDTKKCLVCTVSSGLEIGDYLILRAKSSSNATLIFDSNQY